MARQTPATLKGFFETGDVPTQSNFADLIDSLPMLWPASVSESQASKLKLCCGVVRPTRTGTSLAWAWIEDAQHARVGFSPTITASGTILTLNYDQSYAKVIAGAVFPDEWFAKYGMVCGASVGLSSLTVQCFVPVLSLTSYSHNGSAWAVAGSTLGGNPVSTVSVSGNITTLTLVDYGPGPANTHTNHAVITYSGTNNRYVRFVNSGLGVNQLRFELIDPATGTAQAPASGDRFHIQHPHPMVPIDMAAASTSGIAQDLFQDTAVQGNLWVIAILETA